jgi:hypothetical protein
MRVTALSRPLCEHHQPTRREAAMLRLYAWRAWRIIPVLILAVGAAFAVVGVASAYPPNPCDPF